MGWFQHPLPLPRLASWESEDGGIVRLGMGLDGWIVLTAMLSAVSASLLGNYLSCVE